MDTNYETVGNYLVGGSVPATLPGINDSFTAGGTITASATGTTYGLRWMYVQEGGSANFNFNGNTLELASIDINSATSIRGNMTWQNGAFKTLGTYSLLLGAFNPQELVTAIGDALAKVTAKDALGWFTPCGYNFC